jgi:sugar/nucleoside kinase (ribokinase family)
MQDERSRPYAPVLSMGEVLIDVIVADGATSLEAAETFVARAGGAPANVAVALARLGVASAFCGVVGCDPFGARLTRALATEGVDIARLRQTESAATALAFAWKDGRGDGHFWLLRGADTTLGVLDAEAAGIDQLAALVIGSVSMATRPSRDAITRAVALAFEARVPIVFDINLRPTVWSDPAEAVLVSEQVAAASTLVKLSLDDATGLFGVGTSPGGAIDRILALGAPAVVLTDGERGCWFGLRSRPEPTFVPAFPVDAVEPTGAGDAFCAGLIARLIASDWAPLTLDDVRFAAAAGGLATTKRGAWDGLPTRQQIDGILGSS